MSKRIKRITVGLMIGLALILTILVCALYYLKTDHARALLLTRINASIPGSIECARIDIDPPTGKLALHQAALADPDGEPIATFDSLGLDLDVLALLRGEIKIASLKINHPHLNLALDQNGRLTLLDAFPSGAPSEKPSKGGKPPFNLIVEALELTDGSLTFRKESASSQQPPLSAKIRGLRLTASGNLEQREVDLQIGINNIQAAIANLKTELANINLRAQTDAGLKAHSELNIGETQLAIAGVDTTIHDTRLTADADLKQQQATAKLTIRKAQKSVGSVAALMQEITVNAQGDLKKRLAQLDLNAAQNQLKIADHIIHLDDIQFRSDANFNQQQANLELNINQPRLYYADMDIPLEKLRLDAAFSPERFELKQFLIAAEDSQLSVSGAVLDPLKTPAFDIKLALSADMKMAQNLLKTNIQLTGQTDLDLMVRGGLNNPEIGLQMVYGGGMIAGRPIEAAQLDCRMQDLKVFLRRLMVRSDIPRLNQTGDIDLSGWVDLNPFFNGNLMTPSGDLSKIGYDLTLKAQDLNIARFATPDQKLGGLVDGAIAVKGQGVLPDHLDARASINLNARQVSLDPEHPPTDWDLRADAQFKRQALEIKKLEARGDPFNLNAQAKWEMPSGQIDATIAIDAEDLGQSLAPLGVKRISGGLKLDAHVKGALAHPRLDAALEGHAIRLYQFTIGDVTLDAGLDPKGLLKIALLDICNQDSSLHASGTVQLFEDSFKLSSAMPSKLDIHLQNIALNDFFPKPVFLGRIDGDLHARGDLNDLQTTVSLHGRQFGYDRYRAENLFVDGHIEGPLKEPRAPRTTLTAANLDLGFQKLDAAAIIGDVDLQKAVIEQLEITPRPDEAIHAKGRIDYSGQYQIDLTSTPIDLAHIDALGPQDMVSGKFACKIKGQGSFGDPNVAAEIQFTEMRLNAKAIDPFELRLDLEDHLAQARGRLTFDINANYHLKERTFQVKLGFDQTDLTPYFKLANQPDLSGALTGRVTLDGSASGLDQMRAKAAFGDLRLGYKQPDMLVSRDLQVTFENKRITIPQSSFQILDKGRLTVQGYSELDAQTDIKLNAVLPLELVNHFTDALPETEGNVIVAAQIGGSMPRPDIRGQVNLEKIGFMVPSLMQPVRQINGQINLTPAVVTLEDISGRINKGRFHLNGQVELESLQPQRVDLRLNTAALPVHLPDLLAVNLNSDLHFQGTPDKSTLTGEVVILDGTYYQDIDLSLLKIAQSTRRKKREISSPRPPITAPFLKNLEFDIAVRRRNPFVVDNNLAYLEINPNLDVNGSLNEPVVSGQAEVEAGEVTFNEKTFQIRRGVIEFLNPYKIEPTIDLQSEATIRKWTIFLNIRGTPDQLRFNLTSEPPEEQSDLLALILTGQTARELGQSGGKGSTLSSEMIAAYLGKSLGEDIGKMAGLDLFEVQSGGKGTEDDPETVTVTVGKELSDRMGVTVKMESKAGESVERGEIEYKLLEHFKVKGYQDSRGAFGGELFFRLEFR